MMKIKENESYHGEISIWSPSKNKFILKGRAVFIPKDNKLYSTFSCETPLSIEDKHQIVFQLDLNDSVLVPLDKYLGQIKHSLKNNGTKYPFENYILCDDMDDAEYFLKNGFTQIDFIMNGINSGSQTAITNDFKKATHTEKASVELTYSQEYSDGIKINTESNFSYSTSGNKLRNTSRTRITFSSQIDLAQYDKIINAFELYWDLYKNDTDFSVADIVIKNDGRSATIHTGRTFYEVYSPTANALYVNRPLGREDEMHNIFSVFTSKQKTSKKISYGFSKYIALKKSRTFSSYDMVVIETAIALDSVCGAITKKDIDRESALNSIERIQKTIKNMAGLNEQTKSFYCDSSPQRVYNSITRVAQAEFAEKTCLQLGLESPAAEQESIKLVLEARNSVVHGDRYNEHNMFDDFRGRQTLQTLLDARGHSTYIFGYEKGHVAEALIFLQKVGIKYFEKNNPYA